MFVMKYKMNFYFMLKVYLLFNCETYKKVITHWYTAIFHKKAN